MKTTVAVRHILHRPTLLATVCGGLMMAFVAGATTAHSLLAPTPTDRALAPATLGPDNDWKPDEQMVGRDVYSVRGTPLGRLRAVIGSGSGQGAYALIATYGRDAAIAGEIAIPVSRLDLQGDRLVLADGDAGRSDAEPRRWQI